MQNSINICIMNFFIFLPKAASTICSQKEIEYEKMQRAKEE